MKKLNIELCKGGQYHMYKETLEYNGDKLMLEIKSDSYASQCYARIRFWSDKKWNLIDSIHFSNMETLTKLVHRDNVNASHFKRDRDTLIKLAKNIL
jgi:hypothetical protein